MAELSLLGFIEHLAHFEHRLAEQTHHGLEHAARIVEAEARRVVGHYQAAAGPFAGWAELAEATKADRLHQGFSENDPGLRTGEMRDSVKHAVGDVGAGAAGGYGEAVVGSDDDKLVWFELGTIKQPPRSVLGTAAVHTEADVVAVLGGAVCTALIGRDVFEGKIPISG